MKLSDTEPKYPETDNFTINWDEMTPDQKLVALLSLISQLSKIVDMQAEYASQLEDRVKTLELAAAV